MRFLHKPPFDKIFQPSQSFFFLCPIVRMVFLQYPIGFIMVNSPVYAGNRLLILGRIVVEKLVYKSKSIVKPNA